MSDKPNALDDVRILVVDDQELVRAGIRMICESEPGLSVVGEAADGSEALAMVTSARPDVVLMDVEMPVMDGLTATSRLTATHPARVLILTTFERDDYIFSALEAGASGFLLKNAPPEELVAAIKVVASGAALLAPSVTRRVIEAVVDGRAAPRTPPAALAGLTEREREVLRAVGRGLSNAEVATELFIGEATVKTHVSNVLTKLGLRDRVQAVVFAHHHGLVD